MLHSGSTLWRRCATYLALTGVAIYATLLPWSAAMQQASAFTLDSFAKDLVHALCVSDAPNAQAAAPPPLPMPQSDACEICKAIGASSFAGVLPERIAFPLELLPAAYSGAPDHAALASSSIQPRSRAPPIFS